ncbi:MAG TPA: PDGLE domain-containing protein, partial [Acidimicrobiales bacterium]|nr:PDGLE domain-containing protein [Acidimicrobiales bacterium]
RARARGAHRPARPGGRVSARAGNGRRWWLLAAVVALALAAVVSFYASGDPDGLERVSEDEGFADAATDHDLADGPLADYEVEGVDDDRLSVGVAGVVGVVVTLAVGAGVFRLVRRPDDGDGNDGDGDGNDGVGNRGSGDVGRGPDPADDRPTADVEG